ncbi:MAG: hypothetical protein HUJ96_02400 [Marinilabiliaceae bacterium]|nr:hypothetical protein [Marinilabiliaceae bacterium]
MSSIIKKITYWDTHSWLRTTVKVASIILVAILLFGAIINFILSPSRLTPIVLQYANECLDADVNIGSVDVTFFRSFPRLLLRINDGEIVSHAFHRSPTDTLNTRRDTLIRFSELRAGLNIEHLIKSRKLRLGRLELDNAILRLITDSIGRYNWDISYPDTSAVGGENADTSSVLDYIALRRLKLKNTKIRYTDLTQQISFSIDSINMDADGIIKLDMLNADVDFDTRRSSLKMNGQRYFRRLPIAFNGHIENCDNKYYLKDFHTTINNINLDVDGYAGIISDIAESTSKAWELDLTYKLSSPNVKRAFDIIPTDIKGAELDVSNGSMNFTGSIKGVYANNKLPVIRTLMRIDNVNAKYTGMPEKIEDLSLLFYGNINNSHADSSYVDIDIFHFKGGKSEVTAEAHITSILDDPIVQTKIDGHLDLQSLLNIFPINKLDMKGQLDAKLGAKFRLADIKNQDFGHVVIGGKISTDDIWIRLETAPDTIYTSYIDSTSYDTPRLVKEKSVTGPQYFTLASDLDLKFIGKDTLRTLGSIKRLDLTHPHINIRMRDFEAKTTTYKPRVDTTELATIKADLNVASFFMRLDTTLFLGRKVKTNIHLMHTPEDVRKPHIVFNMYGDSVYTGIYGTRGLTTGIVSEITLDKQNDTTWTSNGKVELDLVRAKTPAYNLPLEARNVRLYQKNRNIQIKNLTLKAGESLLSVSGEVENLYRTIRYKRQPFTGTLSITADTLNLNELMGAAVEIDESEAYNDPTMVNGEETINFDTKGSQTNDSIVNSMKLYNISRRIRFTLDASAKKLKWSKIELNDIKGHVELINGALHMTGLQFKHGTGKAITTLAYKASRKKRTAQVDMFVRWERADIYDIVSSLSIDTIIPALAPFRGKVDCYMAVQTQLDSLMNYDVNKLRASIHFGAKQVTLLDGEQFAKLAKILMFKNKKENIIDTLSLNILVDSGRIEVLPFVANVDRYRAVVGGYQDFDMNMHYHVSVLKSPLPFKAGVNIDGPLENIDYDITTAKLKKKDNPAIQKENDDISLEIRMDILRDTYKISGLPLPEQLKPQTQKE